MKPQEKKYHWVQFDCSDVSMRRDCRGADPDHLTHRFIVERDEGANYGLTFSMHAKGEQYLSGQNIEIDISDSQFSALSEKETRTYLGPSYFKLDMDLIKFIFEKEVKPFHIKFLNTYRHIHQLEPVGDDAWSFEFDAPTWLGTNTKVT